MKCECIYTDLNEQVISCDKVATKQNIPITRFDFTENGNLVDKTFLINVCDDCYPLVTDIKFVDRWMKK